MEKRKKGIYEKYIKRLMDFTLSLCALIVLSPLLLVVAVVGTVVMGGNPFFTQERPGKDEKIFKLVKFRSMTNKTDEDGVLLPDDLRLTTYGKVLRKTSIDELPELWNILKGDMSIVGPRPLLVEYLPYYTEEEKLRHGIRPGLTGWAQVNGRNSGTWEQKFECDIDYVKNITFKRDVYIIFLTAYKVIKRSDVLVGKEIEAGRLDDYRGAI